MKKLVLITAGLIALEASALSADFNGDGTGDIAVFRAGDGLWSVRGITRFYLGSGEDVPVPGDYAGEGTDRAAIFRSSVGLWSVRDLTRAYFGGGDAEPKTGDYDGDGTEDLGIFQPASGLWAAPGITRAYFGASADEAVAPGKGKSPRRTNLLRTGQQESYRPGDDGSYRKGRARSFTDHGDGTVTDNVTGLMWAKDGDGTGCFNGQTATWYEAVDWAEGLSFAEHTDWRLPNRTELISLVDAGASVPAIDTEYFPNTKSKNYWSSTTFASDTDDAFMVVFDVGSTGVQVKLDGDYVRAVRQGR